ncbi:MAG: hypothetical protein OXI41_10785 [Chloroflexota bacterium]|nr:hypothetical protein [Chloroflexota bacterium]MDE2896376.1 hypothetical protein [Chloroflexota bacterium]
MCGTVKRKLRRPAALAIAMALLATAGLSIVSAGDGEIILWGGPGSVTINGNPAPPGTFLWAGVGPDPQEFPNIEQVASDGSWRISFFTDWERVHLYVDGFRVPGGPWDETVPGVPHEIRLDVGADTDPEPVALFFHTRRSDVTLFGEIAPTNAWLCVWIEGRQDSCEGLMGPDVVSIHVAPGSRNIRFTLDGFPVMGPRYDALPELAPFWITLHAGDPERPPFRLQGGPGDVIGPTSGCAWPRDRVYVHAIAGDGWHSRTRPSPDGSWSIDVPAGATGIRIYASQDLIADSRRIPPDAPKVDAGPLGGTQDVKLSYRATGWYILPAVNWAALGPGDGKTQRYLLGLFAGRADNDLDWAWFMASESIDTPGIWLSSFTLHGGNAPQRLNLPDFAENPVATPCSKRIHLEPSQRATATLSFLLDRISRLFPLWNWAPIVEHFLVGQLLREQLLVPN